MLVSWPDLQREQQDPALSRELVLELRLFWLAGLGWAGLPGGLARGLLAGLLWVILAGWPWGGRGCQLGCQQIWQHLDTWQDLGRGVVDPVQSRCLDLDLLSWS